MEKSLGHYGISWFAFVFSTFVHPHSETTSTSFESSCNRLPSTEHKGWSQRMDGKPFAPLWMAVVTWLIRRHLHIFAALVLSCCVYCKWWGAALVRHSYAWEAATFPFSPNGEGTFCWSVLVTSHDFASFPPKVLAPWNYDRMHWVKQLLPWRWRSRWM